VPIHDGKVRVPLQKDTVKDAPRSRPILVGYDGVAFVDSEEGRHALRGAYAIARVELVVAASEHLDLGGVRLARLRPSARGLLGSVSGAVMMSVWCPVIAVPRGVRTSLDDLAGQPCRRRDARGVVASS
jgi:hypothetical protein